MASKWLAAFREVEDTPASISEPCANSAISANSPVPSRPAPPIGTIGTIGTAEQSERGQESAGLLALSALWAGDDESDRAPEEAEEHPAATPDHIEERAAIIEYCGGVPRAWAEGFTAMTAMAPPAGFFRERWQRIIDAAGSFLEKWAADAIRCGWSDLDVFGCDPDRPDARFDCMGLVLLLDRFAVVGIDATGADLAAHIGGARQRFRRRPLPAGTVSLWDLVSRR